MTARAVSDVSDEDLMALADGELPPVEAERLRERLADDPDLAERFALFAETRALLDDSPATANEADARLAASILAMAGPAPAAAPERPVLTAIPGGRVDMPVAPPAPRSAPVWRLPLAASVALGAFAGALATTPSGAAVTRPDGTLTMLSTHRVAGSTICREFRLVSGRQAAIGVGCRERDTWQTVMAIRQPAAADGTFAPVSGATEAADQYLAALGSRGALTAAEEAAALAGR
jgi:anti-sigma factor RsiW